MNPPLRITLLTHSVRPRGGVVHTIELAHALAARGHPVQVIASAEPGESMFRSVDVPFHLLRLPSLHGNLRSQVEQRVQALTQGLPQWLDAWRGDLIHAQDSLNGLALARLRAQGRLSVPWLRTVHHLDEFADATLMQWQARAWQAADDVACVSDGWVGQFRQRFGRTVQRMFNGVNLQRFQPQALPGEAARLAALGLAPGGGPVCLLVGGIESRKNSTRLLRAWAQLRRQAPGWAAARLVVAGGASMLDHGAARREWAEAMQALGLDEGPDQPVLCTGPVDEALVPALMRRADVLAMPSLMEGFGLVAIEALACGTPVLVARRPPFTEHLAGEPAVAWCDPEDVDDIARGLQQALAVPRPVDTPAVCRHHAWSRSAALHEAWYRRCLARCGRPSSEHPTSSI